MTCKDCKPSETRNSHYRLQHNEVLSDYWEIELCPRHELLQEFVDELKMLVQAVEAYKSGSLHECDLLYHIQSAEELRYRFLTSEASS